MGETRQSSGETSALGFQGDPLDADTGLYDLGTRFYDPGLGRFSTRDVLFGDPAAPASLNQFVYGAGDPVSNIDLDGLCAQPDVCGLTHETRKGRRRQVKLAKPQIAVDSAASNEREHTNRRQAQRTFTPPKPRPPEPPARPKGPAHRAVKDARPSTQIKNAPARTANLVLSSRPGSDPYGEILQACANSGHPTVSQLCKVGKAVYIAAKHGPKVYRKVSAFFSQPIDACAPWGISGQTLITILGAVCAGRGPIA